MDNAQTNFPQRYFQAHIVALNPMGPNLVVFVHDTLEDLFVPFLHHKALILVYVVGNALCEIGQNEACQATHTIVLIFHPVDLCEHRLDHDPVPLLNL